MTVAVQLEEYRVEALFDPSQLLLIDTIPHAVEMIGVESLLQRENAVTLFVQSLENLSHHQPLLIGQHLLCEKVVY